MVSGLEISSSYIYIYILELESLTHQAFWRKHEHLAEAVAKRMEVPESCSIEPPRETSPAHSRLEAIASRLEAIASRFPRGQASHRGQELLLERPEATEIIAIFQAQDLLFGGMMCGCVTPLESQGFH